jgi:AcrR family transcriptional regulator
VADRKKDTLDLATLAEEQRLYENPLTEKQRHILEAAERLFAGGGYAQTSTASIAREAGVTEKTLFKHFPTKQDLFRRVLFPLILKTVVPLQIKIVRKVLQTEHKSFRAAFEALARDRWATARHLGPKLKLVLSELLQNDDLRGQLRGLALKNIWPDLIQNVERFQKAGELRADVPAEDIARLQIITIIGHGILRSIIATDRPHDDERDAKIVGDLLFQGIGKAGSAK